MHLIPIFYANIIFHASGNVFTHFLEKNISVAPGGQPKKRSWIFPFFSLGSSKPPLGFKPTPESLATGTAAPHRSVLLPVYPIRHRPFRPNI
jgi:hypothetical protein